MKRARRLNRREIHERWPAIVVADDVFDGYVAERFASGGAIEEELLERNGTDLYLACACSQGNPIAIRAFEELYFAGEVDLAARRSKVVAPEDLRQRVRAKLFVGAPPKIAAYSGRSSLRTWFRAVVGRLVIDVSREGHRDVPTPESDFLELASNGDDPDRRLLQETYRQAFKQAFDLAADRLSPREKNLLRYGLAEGLNIDQIGHIYGVHRVTAARWLQKARAVFVEQIRRLMMERLRLTPSEFESVLRLVISQVDVTIARVLSQAP